MGFSVNYSFTLKKLYRSIMQCITKSAVGLPSLSASRVAKKRVQQKFATPALRVKNQRSQLVCRASVEKKGVAISATIASTLAAATPALALVDERMNGDGVGLALGINDPALGWAILAVFSGVFGLYLSKGGYESDNKGDDSGLSL